MASKKRLIDANKLYFAPRYARVDLDSDRMTPVLAVDKYQIDHALTVDAVEVVRCKECKSWEQYNSCDGTNPHRCMNYDAMFYRRTNPDDFCSCGERKDNERKAD